MKIPRRRKNEIVAEKNEKFLKAFVPMICLVYIVVEMLSFFGYRMVTITRI